MSELAGLLAQARTVSAADRAAIASTLRESLPAGTVLLETCHRVELYGSREAIRSVGARNDGRELVEGDVLARHVVSLAVGLESVVVGEDQVLHQLRRSVREARARGPLPRALDHLLDLALSAGRRARTWLPARRPSLADLAVDGGLARRGGDDAPLLVVGAGEMGSLAARAAVARGVPVLVASRSPARADAVAALVGGSAVPFDPGGVVAQVRGVIVALAGPWSVGEGTRDILVGSRAWVVDLSAPPAVASDLAAGLGDRFRSIDDLARHASRLPDPLVRRLDGLVEETVEGHRRWLAEPGRDAARALAERAGDARRAELAALWRRVPSLDADVRNEVEQMAERLTERLLRHPLERLRGDDDGRRSRAARELFGL